MSTAEKVQYILSETMLPFGGERWFALKNKNGKINSTPKNHPQVVYLGQKISQRVFSRDEKEKYAIMSANSFNYFFRFDRKFRSLTEDEPVWNREIILGTGYLISRPIVRNIDGELKYMFILRQEDNRNKINVKGDTLSALIRGGVMKKAHTRSFSDIHGLPIKFEDGKLATFTKWSEDRYYLGALSPYAEMRLAVFEKITTKKK